MQSCIRPKLFGQSNIVIALRKIFHTLNEKKKMEAEGGSGAAAINSEEDFNESIESQDDAGNEKFPYLCRHAYVHTDDNEFIR